jgi:hypothetical protein
MSRSLISRVCKPKNDRTSRAHLPALVDRGRGKPLELVSERFRAELVAVDSLAVVLLEAERERSQAGDRARNTDRGMRLAANRVRAPLGEQRPDRFGATLQLFPGRRVRLQEPLRQADGADVEAVVPANPGRAAGNELGRAAADVEDDRPIVDASPRADAAKHHQRLVVTRKEARGEPVAPLDLAQEGLAVLGVANGARRDRERALGAKRFDRSTVLGEDVSDARDRHGKQAPALVDPFAEARDPQFTMNVRDPSVVDVGHE